MTFADRVKAARKHAGLTQKELADQVGVSQTAMHKLEVGRSRSSRCTVSISLACGVDPVWLDTGRGAMALQGGVAWMDRAHNEPDRIPYIGRIPLISWQEVGQYCNRQALPLDHDPDRIQFWVPVAAKNGDRVFALTVSDDSMEPDFIEGEAIIVDPTLEPEHNQYVVAQMATGGMATFKQLLVMGNKRYLKPVNQRYPLMEIDGELLVCGIVVSKYKEYL